MLIAHLKHSCFVIIFLAFNVSSEPVTVGISVWSGYPSSVAGFKSSLKDAGFIENETVKYLYRNAGADKEKQQDIAKEFTEKKVDLVYSLTTSGTILIKEYMPPTTPIVFSVVTYPADSGLIESFDYSGNNLVGTSNFVPLQNYVKLLKTVLPNAKKIAIFHREGEPNSKIQTVNLIRLFKRVGINAINVAAVTLDDVERKAVKLAREVDAFVTTTDTLMQGGGELRLIAVSKRTKTPILSSNKQGVIDGSTFGSVADLNTLGKMSGEMAVKILHGEAVPAGLQSKIQDSPLVLVNRNSLQLIGLTLPDALKNYSYVD